MNKSMLINSKYIYVSRYKGKEKKIVSNKNFEVDIWKSPDKHLFSVSIPSGNIIQELFGTTEQYDLIATSFDKSVKVNKKSLIWVNNIPNENLDNNDYLIDIIKYSLNSVVLGLKKNQSSKVNDIWISDYNTTTELNDQPYKIRVNSEIIDDLLYITVSKYDDININDKTLIWFGIDYSESLSDSNYKFKEVSYNNDVIQYILEPITIGD